MDPAEYVNLETVELTHWYYAGKRALVGWWLEKVGPPRLGDVLLDCGAGTGRFAAEWQNRCRVLVLDDHEEALRYLRARFRPEQVVRLSGDAVPLPDGSTNYITALDVLEHVPDPAAVVSGFHRLLTPGGIALITVPAGMALWSDWDVALHHFRRYNRTELRSLFPISQWELVHVNYTNIIPYPVVWFVRKWRRLSGPASVATGMKRAEDRTPPRPLNALLRWLFVSTGKTRLPLPFGVSLLLVARRR